MRAWRIAAALGFGLMACGPGEPADPDPAPEGQGANATPSPALALPPQADGDPDPFRGIEALRPDPWVAWPVENVELEGYDGWRIEPSGAFGRDRGLRFVTRRGAFVLAIADGAVATLERDPDDHLELSLDHGAGIVSHYGPLADALVHAGLPVTRGTAIGLAEGAQLELRVTVDGFDVDPLLFIRQPVHRWPGMLHPPPAPPPEP